MRGKEREKLLDNERNGSSDKKRDIYNKVPLIVRTRCEKLITRNWIN